MKYGQLVEKVPNSNKYACAIPASHELYGQLLEKVSISVEIARKKQFQMNCGQLLEKVFQSTLLEKKQFQMN
jgi:hypothetical protein